MNRILYGIQCTGNGHLTRSKEIIQALKARGMKVDVCLSGNFSQVAIDDLDVIGSYEGLGLDLTNGGVSIINTIKSVNIKQLVKDIISLDLSDYDTIISDFEPIVCWAGIFNNRKVLGVGNHYKFLSNKTFMQNLNPNFFSNKLLVKTVCPVSDYIAFDYLKETQHDYFPIIRDSIRKVNLLNDNSYLVYLSSFTIDTQIKFLTLFPNEIFYIFHNSITEPYDVENCRLRPIDKTNFTEKLIRSKGVICHTGFQTTSECLFLGKKLLVIPIKKQIEQIYNTKILSKLGIPNATNLDIEIFGNYFKSNYTVKIDYMNEINNICKEIIDFRS